MISEDDREDKPEFLESWKNQQNWLPLVEPGTNGTYCSACLDGRKRKLRDIGYTSYTGSRVKACPKCDAGLIAVAENNAKRKHNE